MLAAKRSRSACAIAEAFLTRDSSRTLRSTRYGETYHSSFGAVTESRYVFLELSGVQARLIEKQATSVLEIGFGLGLNFLLTADAALTHSCALSYHAFEHDLVARKTIEAMRYHDHLTHTGLVDQLNVGLFADSGSNFTGHRRATLRRREGAELSSEAELYLNLSDASVCPWPAHSEASFDAVYLDAFSPDTNAECWTTSMFSRLYAALKPTGGTLATYCVKGDVRRRLKSVGFTVTRHPGPPGKREVLTATRSS